MFKSFKRGQEGRIKKKKTEMSNGKQHNNKTNPKYTNNYSNVN